MRSRKYLLENINRIDITDMALLSFLIFILFLGLSSVDANLADFDCFERADSGVGRAFFQVYAWQAHTQTCTPFSYGGFQGNRNRFHSSEECFQSCHGAVLREQLDFQPSRSYNIINRLYDTFEFALKFEQVDHGYFKLFVQPEGELLSVSKENDKVSIDTKKWTGEETQLWDVIPTGEKDYFRIKTQSRVADSIAFLFLQVVVNETAQIDLERRNDLYLGQQWRFV